MRQFIIVFFFLFEFALAHAAWAQFEKNYKPFPELDTIPNATAELLRTRLEAAKARVPEPKSKTGVLAKELYTKSYDYVIRNFNDDAFITEGDLVERLRAVAARVCDANPNLADEITIYVHRSKAPNAATMAGGTIFISLGLVTQLETEDQVAFVICHEMAHHYSRHQEMQLLEIARLHNDKTVRQQRRSITSSEYGVITKANELGLKLELSITQHSRNKEYEADSLGLQLYLNAGYSPSQSLRLLELLDSVDYQSQRAIDLRKHFSFTEYPFKDKWLVYDSTADGFERDTHEISDSLRTHPDCQKRIAALERQLKGKDKYTGIEKSWPDTLREAGKFELVSSAFHYGQYSLAIFNALLLLEDYPDNAWLHGIVAQSLCQVHRLQKVHQANTALPLPAPYYDANYNHFLAFMHNMRLTELESIAIAYQQENTNNN
jgi:Zn-dependent protease with chaperone function